MCGENSDKYIYMYLILYVLYDTLSASGLSYCGPFLLILFVFFQCQAQTHSVLLKVDPIGDELM